MQLNHSMVTRFDVDEETGARTVKDWQCWGCGAVGDYPEEAARMENEPCPALAPAPEPYRLNWHALIGMGLAMASGTAVLWLIWSLFT